MVAIATSSHTMRRSGCQSGELAFGGINGFNLFFPQQVNTRTFMPALLFSSIWVNNKTARRHARCIVRAGNDRITELRIRIMKLLLSFHFTALNILRPKSELCLISWRVGIKTGTIRATFEPSTIINISEGSYWLRVKSTNAEGIWNTQEAI
jgi:hypothetical protein